MISNIKDKINTLAEQRSELKEQVGRLESENQQLSTRVGEMQEELKSLTEKNKVLKMAKSLGSSEVGEESNADAKHKINELVREIDKCIALLNK